MPVNFQIKQERHASPPGDRDALGRFPKGRSGNPAGRPVGSRNAATLLAEAMLDDAAPEITRATLERAYAGDNRLLKAAFQKITPPRVRTVAVALPEIGTAGDLPLAMAAILRALGDSAITPYEAGELARLVDAAARIAGIADFASRLEAVERLVAEAQEAPAAEARDASAV